MNRAFPGRMFFISAYVLLALGFLTTHFTRVENFSTVVGGIVVKGRSSVGTALSPPQIRRFKASANGLELSFKKSSKAVLVTNDGIRHSLDILGWEADTAGITVNMENGAGFVLQADPHGAGLTLEPIVPTTEPPVQSLILPLSPGSGSTISEMGDRPGVLTIEIDESVYSASLPSDSSWDASAGRLNLVVLDKAHPIMEVLEDQRGGGLGAQEWYSQGAVPNSSSYADSLEKWLNLAVGGWTTRSNNRNSLWTDVSGNAVWDDSIAAAVLADSVSRGNYQSTLQNIMAVGESAANRIGWLPSPFLGNIVNQARVMATGIRNQSRQTVADMDAGAPKYATPGLLSMLVDSGSQDQARRLVEMARQGPPPETPNADILGRLEVLRDAKLLSLDDPAEDRAIRESYFDGYLIPRIFWVKDGLWLVEEDGSVDAENSIRTGALMLQESQWNNNGVYQAVGRQLIMSVLSLSDNEGIVPKHIFFEGDGSVRTEDQTAPEEFYAMISPAPALPRRVSLANELGTGSWAITGAEKFTLRSGPRETTISLDFPSGSIHHLAIKGIKEFKVLFMNGIRWNGDPNFQRYYAGWYYDAAAETLYVKIRHRSKTETIRILNYDPDAPADAEGTEVASADAEATTP